MHSRGRRLAGRGRSGRGASAVGVHPDGTTRSGQAVTYGGDVAFGPSYRDFANRPLNKELAAMRGWMLKDVSAVMRHQTSKKDSAVDVEQSIVEKR
jgi:hypothetical protein